MSKHWFLHCDPWIGFRVEEKSINIQWFICVPSPMNFSHNSFSHGWSTQLGIQNTLQKIFQPKAYEKIYKIQLQILTAEICLVSAPPCQLSWAQVIADDLNLLTNYFMRLTFAPPKNWHRSPNWCWILIQLCQSWLYICTYSILRVHSLENLIGCFATFLRKEIPVLFCLNVLVTQNTSMPSEGCAVKSNTPYFAYSFLWFKLTNY